MILAGSRTKETKGKAVITEHTAGKERKSGTYKFASLYSTGHAELICKCKKNRER